jgi:hypothetical protein
MAHSTFATDKAACLIRDDLMEYLVRRLREHADATSNGSLLQLSAEWEEHCEIMPPGAKRIRVDLAFSDEDQRRGFVQALTQIESSISDPQMRDLIGFACLKGLVGVG